MDRPPYNNIPFSTDIGDIFLPATHLELAELFKPTELLMSSFFSQSFFSDPSSYRPSDDFSTRPRRTSGDLPVSSYPQKLVEWFYTSDSGHPFIYEEARELYFSISIPFTALSDAFQGSRPVPVSGRKTFFLNFVSKFDRHLVRVLSLIRFFY